MRIPRQWKENEDVFNFVSEALMEAGDEAGIDIDVRDEEDAYGDRGYIYIKINGKRFSLTLNEEA